MQQSSKEESKDLDEEDEDLDEEDEDLDDLDVDWEDLEDLGECEDLRGFGVYGEF